MYPQHRNAIQRTGSLLDANDMEFVLERERVRAERSKSQFALVLLDWQDNRQLHAVQSQLTRTLANRLRLTDEAGWVGDRKVALLLTDTSEGGAWSVVRYLCEQLGEAAPKCEVFVYPQLPSKLPVESAGENNAAPPTSGVRRADQRAKDAAKFFCQPIPTWKRIVDVVVGGFALALAAPILLIAAIAIKLTSRGPIFFTQERTGLGGNPFTIFKLRTMVTDAESQKASLRAISEQDGPAFKLRNDPRVTPIGRFLRKSCVDELPQLWNVIRGEMSIVGPRPLPVDEAAKCQDWEKRRLDVTPGLTCIWQVRGALKVSFSEWMRMDIRYIRRRNVLTDIKLMMQTAIAVLAHRASC